jgi:inosine-uridine nucleoside N-ribohydrolase
VHENNVRYLISLECFLRNLLQIQIPIYKGMDSSLVGKYENTQRYHGQDGFGDASKLPQIPTRVQPDHAVEAIIKFAETYPGKFHALHGINL